MQNVIAIDGPAASGKSTIAKTLARTLGIPYINTGNMYRAVTVQALGTGLNPDSELSDSQIETLLSGIELDYIPSANGSLELRMNGIFPGDAIRSPEVTTHVSKISAIPAVRDWLVKKQREFASSGQIVMEGRDIGTVVFPQAKNKFFLTASPEVRAKRRLAQDGETFNGATVESVAREIAARDEMDMNRAVSPLRKADDATLIDSSNMTVDEVIAKIVSLLK